MLRDRSDPNSATEVLTIPWAKSSSHRRREILEPATPIEHRQPIRVDEQARLVRAIATARKWVNELIDGKITDTNALAIREGKSERSIRMLLSLAFLDPALIKAACEGRLPRGYGVTRLVDLPAGFDDQWKALGLRRAA